MKRFTSAVSCTSTVLLVVTVLLALPSIATAAGQKEVTDILDQLENDVLLLAQAAQVAYQKRKESLVDCGRSNYESSYANFSTPTCMNNTGQYYVSLCDNTDTCGSKLDFNQSNVVLNCGIEKNDGNPTDPQIIESVCSSRYLDETFRNISQKYNTPDWQKIGRPTMYFGSQLGTFRIFPARLYLKEEFECDYDPRNRIWYISAIFPPKKVILVMDTTTSKFNNAWSTLIMTAKAVINNLITGDYVAIIAFNDISNVIGDENGNMVKINATTKSNLLKNIDLLSTQGPGGNANFYNGLQTAFDILENSTFTDDCSSAILLLTGAKEFNYDFNHTKEDVQSLVSSRLQSMNHFTFFFTYNIGDISGDNVKKLFPKQLACNATNNADRRVGFWANIKGKDKIFDGLASYYRTFAYRGNEVASDGQEEVAWADFYPSASTDSNVTTVSAPVYDYSTTPPTLLGVVGIDVTEESINNIADGYDWRGDFVSERVEKRPTCRNSDDLSNCHLNKLRFISGNDESICFISTDSCALVPETWENATFPKDLWQNTALRGADDTVKVCCDPYGTCPASDLVGGTSSSPSTTPAVNSSTTPAVNSSTPPAVNSSTTPAVNSSTTPAVNSSTTPVVNSSTTPAVNNSSTTLVVNSSTTPGGISSTPPAVNDSSTPPVVLIAVVVSAVAVCFFILALLMFKPRKKPTTAIPPTSDHPETGTPTPDVNPPDPQDATPDTIPAAVTATRIFDDQRRPGNPSHGEGKDTGGVPGVTDYTIVTAVVPVLDAVGVP